MKTNTLHRATVTALFLILPLAGLFADGESKVKLQMSTELWPGYEFLDRQPTGPDASGSGSEDTGFSVRRAYLTLKGRHYNGSEKGIGFRITADLEQNPPDSCSGSSCKSDNPYYFIFKYAYVDLPVTEWFSLRLGQQHMPVIDGQAGVSLQKMWDHRYIEKTPWEDYGVVPASTDRGISAIFDTDYLSFHVLLSNGEGYKANNAQARLRGMTTPSTVLSKLSSGADASYGLNLSGMLSISPLGKKGTHQVHISTPFYVQNVAGLSGQETSIAAFDACSDSVTLIPTAEATGTTCTNILTTLKPAIYKGHERALRDYATGAEVDYKYSGSGFEFTVGTGYIRKVDQRATAYRIRPDVTLTGTFTDLAKNYTTQEDQIGEAAYAFLHGRYRYFGAFVRFGTGTGNGTASSSLSTSDRRDYWRQMVALDAKDNQFGNLTYSDALAVDFSRARFKQWIFGTTLFASDDFRVSLGYIQTTATDTQGGTAKVSLLDAYTLPGGSSVSSTLSSSSAYSQIPAFYQALGYTSSSGFKASDYGGRRDIEKQIFIRAQFTLGGEFEMK